jgi:hypothetical protein
MRFFHLRSAVLAVGLTAVAGFLAYVEVPAAFSQVTTAAIHGTVTDPSGAVIPNAKITALDTATGISKTTTSDKSGYFIFPELQVGGPYAVTVSVTGFHNFVASGLTLNVNDNREVNASLKVGSTTQTIEVAAMAVQVETSNTQLQQVANAQQLEGVPLEGRDPAGLEKLTPGIMESSDRIGTYSSNGSQTTQNSYLLNGTDINDGPLQNEGIAVNPDALQEENIVTSTMNPEFSRNSGAVINEVIKSGTNQIHGSGFEFYRDTFLNNGNYFSPPGTRPVFHQNLYGGTLGGPIVKNKLFAFLAYQGYRNRTAQTTNQPTMTGTKSTTSPTGQFGGAFSTNTNWGMGFVPDNTPFSNEPTNPASGLPYCPNIPNGTYSDSLSCNPIPFPVNGYPAGTPWIVAFNNGGEGSATINVPPGTWNSIAKNLIQNYVPGANYPAASPTEYNFNALNSAAEDQGVIRLDYTPSSRDSIWASNVFQSSPSFNTLPFGGGSFPGFPQENQEHYKIFSASWMHTFSPTKLNELHAGYYRINFPSVIPTTPVLPSTLGFSINPQLTSGAGVPFIGIGGLFNLGFSFEGPQPRTDTNANYADNFTWIRGNHSLKFGASFEQFRVHNPFGYYNNGDYGYYGGLAGGGAYSSGDPLMDFVLGIPDTYNQTNDGFIDVLAAEYYAYVQDNWKVSPDLTLNFGVGWDAEEPYQNHQFGGLGITCWANSSATSKVFPGGPPGLTYNGDPGCNTAGGVPTRYDHFTPRIGFAWSPSSGPSAIIGRPGSHDFSVRGGFGVYFNRDAEEQSLQNLGDPPNLYMSHGAADFGGSPAFANPFADVTGCEGCSEANPYPYSPPKAGGAVNWGVYTGLELAVFSPTYAVPYSYNFNLNIQRALPGNLLMQVGYVGALGRRLSTWYEGDNITQAGHDDCLANPSCSPGSIHLYFPQYTAQPAVSPSGIPWYESVADQNTEGSSNYNSLQASLIQSPYHGLQFTLGYTWSHALDNGSSYESGTGGDAGYGNGGHVYNYVPGFQYLNYGDSDYDARQRLVASYVYTVPVSGFLKKNLFFREALSGWGIGGLTAVQDGFPISVTMGADLSYWCDGYSYFGCPDVPETSSFNIKRYNPRSSASNQYFDTTPFSPEPLGTFGNTRRNFFHGPGFNYTNLQISKNFPLSADGSRYMQWRLEAFNAFNHANFASPGGSYANSAYYGQVFGSVNSVIYSQDPNADPQPARAIQLVGKIYF